VLTDNRVWTTEDGHESVSSNRSDSMGLEHLQKSGVPAFVISKETNPVVAARCEKLGIGCKQGIDDKASAFKALLAERGVAAEDTIFVGNDTNDLPCFPLAGCAVAVADSHSDVLRQADQQLSQPGGRGAIRELCDLILEINSQKENE
jgi:N-acylneuraminate cytidylyltransferase